MTAIARESARKARAAEAASRGAIRESQQAAKRAQRQAIQLDRDTARANTQAERQAKQRYLESRQQEVDELNADQQSKMAELSGVLEHTLKVDDAIAFEVLRISDEHPPLRLPSWLTMPAPEPDKAQVLGTVAEPKGFSALLPGAKKRFATAQARAEREYEEALANWRQREAKRQRELDEKRAEWERSKQAFESKKAQRNAEADELEQGYRAADPDAVVAYCGMVLERSEYPDGLPQEFRLAFVRESKQLVIEYELPAPSIVPTVQEYRYIRTKDEIAEKPRKAADIKEIYQDLVAAIALRTIHEVLEADQAGHLDVVCFNGFVQTVDPATGRDIRPHLISLRATRERFMEVDLSRVDKKACLRNLGAQVSPRPDEAQPVKPVVDFDMVDPRFVEQSDVLADLEARPNLMDLNPFEFENLVANLFKQMGLESKLTRSSRDGGVDCIAFDPRPVLGGKVVIQAKRYRHTVGVSAVRDLYGTMMNEGANKGILVATSGYGPDAFDFCKDKPIELIDGGALLYLLGQVGIQARIVLPAE